MLLDVIDVKYIDDYKIKIVFENGKEGIVDLEEYCQKGGMFNNLREKNYFIKFYLNKDLGTICWPNGLDIAPEALFSRLK